MLPPKRDLPFLKPSQKSSQRIEDVIPDSQASQISQRLVPTQSQLEPVQIARTIPDSQPSQSEQQAVPVPVQSQPDPVRTRSAESERAPVSVESRFASYLSAPTPERIAFLENWMCELIEDDQFLALCEDVEATWKRFAFGKER